MDPTAIWELVDKGGTAALFLLIIVGGIRKWWVFGWMYEAALKQSEKWEGYALKGTDLAEKLTDTTDDITRKLAAEAALEALTTQAKLQRKESDEPR